MPEGKPIRAREEKLEVAPERARRGILLVERPVRAHILLFSHVRACMCVLPCVACGSHGAFVRDVNVSKLLNTVRKQNIIHHLSTETNALERLRFYLCFSIALYASGTKPSLQSCAQRDEDVEHPRLDSAFQF